MNFELKNKWLSLPDYLRVIVMISMMIPCATLPIFFSAEILKIEYIITVVATFCVFPLLLVAAIFMQSLFVVPIYFLESLLMILFSFHYIKMESLAEEVFRILAMLALTVGGTFILSRDHIIPLIQANKRNKWRQSRRQKVGELVKIQFDNEDEYHPIVLHNSSEKGLSFSGYKEFLPKNYDQLSFKAKEKLYGFKMKVGAQELAFKAHVAWIFASQEIYKIGLKLEAASHAYSEISSALETYRAQKTNWLQDAWHKPEIRRLALAVWIISVASNVFAPSCGRQDADSEKILAKVKNIVTVPIVIGTGTEGFQLSTLINDYEIEVKGCKSAYTKVIRMNSPDPILKLPEGDVGCRAHLNYVTLNSEVYTNINGVNFDPALGSVNIFENAQHEAINIKTWIQLIDPISTGAAISFEILSGSKGAAYSIRGPAVSRVNLDSSAASISERNGSVTFTLTRDAYISTPMTVNLKVSGTAIAGVDYTTLNSTQVFATGQSSISFVVSTINDTVKEVSESLILEVLPGTGYWGLDSSTVTIIDDDMTTLLSQPFWYDGANTNPSTVGGSVKQLNDKSGNNNHADQTTKNKQAVLNKNSNQNLLLNFDGVNDFYNIPQEIHTNLGTLYKEKTFYLAFEIESAATLQVLFEQGGEDAGFSIVYFNGALHFGAWNLAKSINPKWGPVFVSAPVDIGQLHFIKAEFDAWEGELRLELNGQLTSSSTAPVGDMHKHNGGISLGATKNGTRVPTSGTFVSGNVHFFSGKLYEAIGYNSILSAQESIDMDNYFFNKYSISP
ncbi:MAG: hypothetical protein KBD78_01060 [Oligoflexales bacterium]|nr:hypothetical protein [Oligoflexales bacterium]